MAVISFGDKTERVWAGAGWAFRQVLRDLSAYAQGDSEFQVVLEQAGHTGSLVVDILNPDLHDRINGAILRMCNEVIDGTRPSTVYQFHTDRETQDLYRQELELIRSAAKAPKGSSTGAQR